MKKSAIGTLNWSDAVKGLALAVSSAVLTALTQMLTLVPPAINWREIGLVSVITTLSYLGKQVSTNSDGKLLKKED